jgi:hypothetical protein
MRKSSFAAIAAALLVLPSAAAQAKAPLVNLGDICGSLVVIVDHSRVSGFSLTGCQTGNFVGVLGKVQGTEGRSIIGSLEMLDGKHRQYVLQLSYPLVNGGTWRLSYTTDGYKSKVYQQGTYTVIK